MFGGWNDVLKQCPKCAAESYRGQPPANASRRQLPNGGGRGGGVDSRNMRSGDWRGSGGMNRSHRSGSNVYAQSSSDKGRQPSDRGVMNRQTPDVRQQMLSQHRGTQPRQYRGDNKSRYPGGASKHIPQDANLTSRQQSGNQFYSSLHFQKPQEEPQTSSRRQSAPDVAALKSSTYALTQQQSKPTISQRPSKTQNVRRAHFVEDSRATPRFDQYEQRHPVNSYTYGDEGRRRDMVEDTNEDVAVMRISNLKPGYPAFIKRSTGKWTFAKVKKTDPDFIVFNVDAYGSSKAYHVKHWASHIRTLKSTSHDIW